MRKATERPLRILETHQGKGEATNVYRKYGCVISFEVDPETYEMVYNRFPDAFSLEACLEKGVDMLDLIQDYESFRFFSNVLLLV